MKGDKRCPNFVICRKLMNPTLRVCNICYWRFNNEVLQFDNSECPICYNTQKCVKFLKCTHYVCPTCFAKVESCPMCRSDPEHYAKLKEAGITLINE